jgi:hypothetical protein
LRERERVYVSIFPWLAVWVQLREGEFCFSAGLASFFLQREKQRRRKERVEQEMEKVLFLLCCTELRETREGEGYSFLGCC